MALIAHGDHAPSIALDHHWVLIGGLATPRIGQVALGNYDPVSGAALISRALTIASKTRLRTARTGCVRRVESPALLDRSLLLHL